MAEINSSITNGVLFVSLGVLIFIMIFCFAKRQISRFALKSSKSPHETIGHHAPTALLLEIERRLRKVKDISIEPRLLPANRHDELKRRAKNDPGFYYYRMQTLDSVSHLYEEIKKCNPGAVKKVGVALRVFLFEQRQVGCLEGIRLEVIEKFCSSYDHARHDPKIFTKNDYKEFQAILKLLLHYIHNKNTKNKLILEQQQQYDIPPSPTEHSPPSDGSLKKLIPSPTFANKQTRLNPTAIKSPFQSMARAFTDNNDLKSRITSKMYATANFMGRTGPSMPDTSTIPPNIPTQTIATRTLNRLNMTKPTTTPKSQTTTPKTPTTTTPTTPTTITPTTTTPTTPTTTTPATTTPTTPTTTTPTTPTTTTPTDTTPTIQTLNMPFNLKALRDSFNNRLSKNSAPSESKYQQSKENENNGNKNNENENNGNNFINAKESPGSPSNGYHDDAHNEDDDDNDVSIIITNSNNKDSNINDNMNNSKVIVVDGASCSVSYDRLTDAENACVGAVNEGVDADNEGIDADNDVWGDNGFNNNNNREC